MANKKAKTPMAVNKSNTPAWMKVVIIAIVISFTAGGVAIVAAGIGGGGGTSNTGAAGDSITSKFQPRVDAAITAANANPDNPDIVAQVGHAYYEWAVALYESGQQSASIPFWISAVSYYEKVLAIDPEDDVVLGNRAFALFYAQDERAKDAMEAFIASAENNASLSAQVENARGMLDSLSSATTTTTP